jgi:uncharacterized protein YsxB (DUF464 family)
VGEILIKRDERHRILGLTGRGLRDQDMATTSARHFLEAAVGSMTEYLHLHPVYTTGEPVHLTVDRSDPHLDRENDAIMETLLMGLRLLEKAYPDELVVHEAEVEIQV